MSMSEGRAVVTPGESNDASLFVLESGICTMMGPSAEGSHRTCSAGSMFGDIRLSGMLSETVLATVMAATPVKLWTIEHAMVVAVCRGVGRSLPGQQPAPAQTREGQAGEAGPLLGVREGRDSPPLQGESVEQHAARKAAHAAGPMVKSVPVPLPSEPDLIRAKHALVQTLQDEPIALHELERIAILGTGAFAYVVLVRCRGRVHALKVLSKSHVMAKGLQMHVLREKGIMSSLSSAFLVNMAAALQDSQCLYMLLDFQQGGEFFTYLQNRTDPLSESSARFYAACVVAGLEYMHSKGVAWRDLKPENLLLDGRGYLRLADFGFAKRIAPGSRSYTLCGTPEYLAPEILMQSGHGLPVDWWALGVLLYEMVAWTPPFHQEERAVMFRAICSANYTMPAYFSKDLKDLIRRLLNKQPSRRLGTVQGGVSDIRKHPWFAGFDWSALVSQRMPAPFVPKVQGPEDMAHFEAGQEVAHKLLGSGRHVSVGTFADF
ncbi:cAMP-dependent protein kinase catalytic subunit alpha [Auxenochlorella protothecoides]|nr:cAMP-dependent protein kinase catalytic subunit alpha [Auxenochlorella protothecoides]KFM26059.1 cAMP-dependent protein kinase catalytic subunit alpha [Auxenochlorella protothecoides]